MATCIEQKMLITVTSLGEYWVWFPIGAPIRYVIARFSIQVLMTWSWGVLMRHMKSQLVACVHNIRLRLCSTYCSVVCPVHLDPVYRQSARLTRNIYTCYTSKSQERPWVASSLTPCRNKNCAEGRIKRLFCLSSQLALLTSHCLPDPFLLAQALTQC